MDSIKSLRFGATDWTTTNAVTITKISSRLSRVAQSFTGDGRKYDSIRWYLGATAGAIPLTSTLKCGIQKDDGTLPWGTPTGTYIGYAHTTCTWNNASVRSWMSFTFGTPSGWIATAGNKYWMVWNPVTWVAGDTIKFAQFGGFTSSYPSGVRMPLPNDEIDTNVRLKWKTAVINQEWRNYSSVLAAYLIEHTTSSFTESCAYGNPYHQLITATIAGTTTLGMHFRLSTATYLSTVKVFTAKAASAPKTSFSLYAGTSYSYLAQNLKWHVHTAGTTSYTWNALRAGPTTVLPAGYYTLLCSSHNNGFPAIMPYVIGDPIVSQKATRYGTSFAAFYKTIRRSTADIFFEFTGSYAYSNMQFRIRDWYFNTVQPNISVTYKYGGATIDTRPTSSTGWCKFSTIQPGQSVKFIPSYGTWDFSTPYWGSANMTINATAHFIKGPNTQWPNIATPFAFRQLLLVSSAHTALPKGYLMNCNIRTGPSRMAGSNGHFNESLGVNPAQNIAYYNNKTHIVWRAENGDLWGNTWKHNTKSWVGAKYLAPSHSDMDSHYTPHIIIDKNGYIHLVHNGHDLSGITKATAWMMSAVNDLVETSTKIHQANSLVGSYQNMSVDNNNTIFMFSRLDRNPGTWGYSYKRDASNTTLWATKVTVAIATSGPILNKSWYSSGVHIDKNNYMHVCLCMLENYGELLYKSWVLQYMYSPPSYISPTVTEPGHYWYAANGSVVAILINDTVSPLRYRSATCIATYFHTVGSEANYENTQSRYIFTNTKSIFAHPAKTFTSGGLTVQRPYIAFSAGTSVEPNGAKAAMAWYNPSAPNANIRGWVVRDLTTAIGYTYGATVRPWFYRTYGPMVIDHQGFIRSYCSTKYKNPQKASASWGGEIFEYRSEDFGDNWKGRLITDNSSIGIPLISVKSDMTNQMLELVYSRGRDIHYYSESSPFPEFRDDGKDIAIIFSGTPTPKVIDSVANYYNFSTSEVVFALHTAIPKNYPCSTAGQYYIYYGRNISTSLAADPRKIYILYENFEQAAGTVSTGLFSNTINNANSWRYISKMPYRTTEISTSAWKIVGTYPSDMIGGQYVQGTNKIYAGSRALYSWIGTSGAISGVSTCYVYTTVPIKWRRNIAIEGSIWYENIGSLAYNAMIGFTVGSTHTIVGVGLTSNGFGYYTGGSWRATPSSGVVTDVPINTPHYHRFKAQIIGTAFHCYANNSSSVIGYVSLPYQCSAQRLILCRPMDFIFEEGMNYFDYIKAYPAFPGTYLA